MVGGTRAPAHSRGVRAFDHTPTNFFGQGARHAMFHYICFCRPQRHLITTPVLITNNALRMVNTPPNTRREGKHHSAVGDIVTRATSRNWFPRSSHDSRRFEITVRVLLENRWNASLLDAWNYASTVLKEVGLGQTDKP